MVHIQFFSSNLAIKIIDRNCRFQSGFNWFELDKSAQYYVESFIHAFALSRIQIASHSLQLSKLFGLGEKGQTE